MYIVGDYQIDLFNIIGEGAQARIVTGKHLGSLQPVAVKLFSLKTIVGYNSFENEVNLLHECKNISQVVGIRNCFTHNQFGFLIMDLHHQDLLSFIVKNNGLGEAHAINLFRQICLGVKQCHDRNIAHLDLKPDNILCDFKGDRVFLCDFGNSYKFNNCYDYVDIGRRGTVVYCAPEVKKCSKYNPVKADIWSLGILLHTMVAGYFPRGQTQKDFEKYDNGEINLSFIQQQCSTYLFGLLNFILQPLPHMRPSIDDILNHPWFHQNYEPRLKPLSPLTLKLSNEAKLPNSRLRVL